jgi:hypothetical protein
VHMKKCIIIGYPQGFKGWKFYNPLTRQVLISECADFDECFFMNQEHLAPHLPSPCPESLLESPSIATHLPIMLDSTLDDCKELECSQQPIHGGRGIGLQHLTRLLFALRHPYPLIIPFLPLQLRILCTLHLLILLPLYQHLLLTLSTQGNQDLNGSQSNWLSHSAIGRSESLLQPFSL